MMGLELLTTDGRRLLWRNGPESLMIEPWGKDSLRVRATHQREILELPWALLQPEPLKPLIEISETHSTIQNGKIQAEISQEGILSFRKTDSETVFLAEPPHPFPDNFHLGPRQFRTVGGDLFHIQSSFQASIGERFYGLGQHQHGLLDQKGCTIDLIQVNTEVAIPFLLSSRGYGFLWNNPAIGRVELGANHTRWVAQAARQMDYWITVGDTPADIMHNYADATGHSPMLPAWAAGFWQSKLRYSTQDELLSIAREYQARGLPLSVIVIDGLHWTLMGDWKFDPIYWPDPEGMGKELQRMGVKAMVSIWPTVNALSPNFNTLMRKNLLVQTVRGLSPQTILVDSRPEPPVYLHLYDPTNPQARRFIWDQVLQGYHRFGIKAWWLDACEPEIFPVDHDNLRYHLGSGLELGCSYPLFHQQAFYDGMRSEGEEDIIMLSRSAWAGSQRYGAAVWSGDIQSTFTALNLQVPAGLNIGLSGIPWWTTDIGGFHGGDPNSPAFQELIVRWFQYGVFCPIFRLHGFRLPIENWNGSANEVWSFGDRAYTIIKDLLFLRQRLLPYIMNLMQQAHLTGAPPMRPLFFEFPEDATCVSIADQFMFGNDLLVSPILSAGTVQRPVYLPAGTSWRDAWSGTEFSGGTWIEAHAPIERVPLYLRIDQSNSLNKSFLPIF